MKRILIITLALTLFVGILPLAGCGSDKISDILANPDQYQGQEVTIKGTVGEILWLALLSKGAYEISDDSNTIWVTTTKEPPSKGSEVSVQGTVSTAVKIGEHSLGTVITETKRK